MWQSFYLCSRLHWRHTDDLWASSEAVLYLWKFKSIVLWMNISLYLHLNCCIIYQKYRKCPCTALKHVEYSPCQVNSWTAEVGGITSTHRWQAHSHRDTAPRELTSQRIQMEEGRKTKLVCRSLVFNVTPAEPRATHHKDWQDKFTTWVHNWIPTGLPKSSHSSWASC